MQTFDDIHTDAARALQIWQILIGKASRRQTVTYDGLRKIIGFKKGSQRFLGKMLGPIYHFCKHNNLPPLTIIVVGKNSGIAGEGMPEGDRDDLRELVYAYRWFRIVSPTMKEFEKMRKSGSA